MTMWSILMMTGARQIPSHRQVALSGGQRPSNEATIAIQ